MYKANLTWFARSHKCTYSTHESKCCGYKFRLCILHGDLAAILKLHYLVKQRSCSNLGISNFIPKKDAWERLEEANIVERIIWMKSVQNAGSHLGFQQEGVTRKIGNINIWTQDPPNTLNNVKFKVWDSNIVELYIPRWFGSHLEIRHSGQSES